MTRLLGTGQAAERGEISKATFLVGSVLVDLARVTGAVFPTLATDRPAGVLR